MAGVGRLGTVLPITVAVFAACGGSPESKARKAERSLASWTATAKLTAELWYRGQLPATYLTQVEAAVAEGKNQARHAAEAR